MREDETDERSATVTGVVAPEMPSTMADEDPSPPDLSSTNDANERPDDSVKHRKNSNHDHDVNNSENDDDGASSLRREPADTNLPSSVRSYEF